MDSRNYLHDSGKRCVHVSLGLGYLHGEQKVILAQLQNEPEMAFDKVSI